MRPEDDEGEVKSGSSFWPLQCAQMEPTWGESGEGEEGEFSLGHVEGDMPVSIQ